MEGDAFPESVGSGEIGIYYGGALMKFKMV
jgi:hypothetical protein